MAKRSRTAAGKSESTALVIDQARHYMRYFRVKEQGEKVVDLARSEGVTPRAIEKSIRQVEIMKGLYTQTNLNASMTGVLLSNLGRWDETLQRMFKAKDYVERKLIDGSTELIPIDDKPTQIKALEVFLKGIDSMQPKGGGLNVRVQQTNANQAVATASTGAGGYESILHSVMKESNEFNRLPSEVGDVLEAEESEGDDDDEDGMVIEG